MTIKTGDLVRVKPDLNRGGYYGGNVHADMLQYKGQIFKATVPCSCGRMGIIKLEGTTASTDVNGGCYEWHWSEDMLEIVQKSSITDLRFKIGDRVMIKEDLEPKSYRGHVLITSDMPSFGGNEATVVSFDKCGSTLSYRLDVDNKRRYWTDDMLIPVKRSLKDLDILQIVSEMRSL